MKSNNKGFTLVELLISVVVLIILVFIVYHSYVWYAQDAKDSKRLVELDNIVTSIETYKITNWRAPIPDDYKDITYSWSLVWKQWVFWEEMVKLLWYSKQEVLDPNEKSKYTYSVKSNQREYSLAWVLENSESPDNIYLASNEDDWLKNWNAIVRWNYNWAVTHLKMWSSDYILALPSIISSDLSSTNLEDIIDNNNLVLNGFQNLPESYSWSDFRVDNNLDFSAENLLIFSWSLSNFMNESERLSLLYILQKSYSWALYENDSFLTSVINTPIDLIYPDKTDLDLSCDLVNKKLNYKIDCNYVNFSSFYVIDEPYDIWVIDFSILSWLQVNYIYQEWSNLRFWTSSWIFSYSLDAGIWTTYEETAGYKISVIAKDNDDNMWFWTSDSWLLVYDWTDFINYQSDYDPPHINTNHFTPTSTNWIPSNAIYDIAVDISWNVLIWTHNWWSYYDWEFHDFYIESSNNKYLYSENRLKSFFIDHNNYIWLWTDAGAFLYRWDVTWIETWVLEVFDWNDWLPYQGSKSKIRVNTIFEDSEESWYNMWFWTIYWIWKLDKDLNPVKIYTTNSGEWLANNDVKSIFEDLYTSKMWFWTNEWVSILSWSTFDNYTKDVDWITLGSVFYIYQDENGLNILWTENWSTTIE
jgi:prepilin-type N-terminal cleavage/methylation domain-containing protein